MIIWTPRPNPKRGEPARPRGSMAAPKGTPTDANIRRARWMLLFASVAVMATAFAAAYAAWHFWPSLPVTEVVFHGELKRTSPEELQRMAAGIRGDVLQLDLAQVRAQARRLPWVRDAQVRRTPPGQIEIALEEHEPIAVWEQDGGRALLNRQLEVFVAPGSFALPLIAGPAGTAPEVWQQRQQFMRILGAEPAEVRLSARRAWRVKLTDATVLELGRNDPEPRLARFVRARTQSPLLQAAGGQVDLRYATGMALMKTAAMRQLELEQEQQQAGRKKKA